MGLHFTNSWSTRLLHTAIIHTTCGFVHSSRAHVLGRGRNSRTITPHRHTQTQTQTGVLKWQIRMGERTANAARASFSLYGRVRRADARAVKHTRYTIRYLVRRCGCCCRDSVVVRAECVISTWRANACSAFTRVFCGSGARWDTIVVWYTVYNSIQFIYCICVSVQNIRGCVCDFCATQQPT